MLIRKEITSSISTLEIEIEENLNKQEAVKQSYEGTLAELEESKAAKEEEKKASKKPLFAKLTKKGKAYLARMAQLDADIQDVQNQIDNLYTSDKEYVALTAEYDLMCEELVHLNEQMTECIFIEKLDKNRVYIYGTGYAESDNMQIVIDGERLGDFASPIGIYPLSEGDHTLYIVRDYEMTKTIHFTLNGNNKFVYFEMERYAINNTVYQKMQRCEASYKSNVSDGFYEFVEENKLCDCTAQKIRNYVLDL